MQSAEEEEETATKTVGAAAVATSHFMSAAAAVQWGKEGTCFSRSLHSPSFLASSSCSLGNLGQKRCHVWQGCQMAKFDSYRHLATMMSGRADVNVLAATRCQMLRTYVNAMPPQSSLWSSWIDDSASARRIIQPARKRDPSRNWITEENKKVCKSC